MQCLGRNPDDAYAQSCVHEGLVQVLTFEGWHTTIFACLAVEDEVDGDEGGACDAGAIEQALRQITGVRAGDLVGLLHIVSSRLEGMARFGEGCDCGDGGFGDEEGG